MGRPLSSAIFSCPNCAFACAVHGEGTHEPCGGSKRFSEGHRLRDCEVVPVAK